MSGSGGEPLSGIDGLGALQICGSRSSVLLKQKVVCSERMSRYDWAARIVIAQESMEFSMAKNKARDVSSFSDQSGPYKALLFEVKGKRDPEDGTATTVCTEMFAALSMEEVMAHVRRRQTNIEIVELKLLGKVQVLSSSENLE